MYWFHRACHRITFLRRIHAVHHQEIDPHGWSTGILHPLEGLGLLASFLCVPLLCPMAPLGAVYLSLVVFIVLQVHEHAKTTPCREHPWLVDSSFHHRHHRRMQGNYAFIFRIWDDLFHTTLS